MADEIDIRTRHAERRRAFLKKTAMTGPVVGLLLDQASHPARAQTYGGATTTPFDTTTGFTTTTGLPITTAATMTFAPTSAHVRTTTAHQTTTVPSP